MDKPLDLLYNNCMENFNELLRMMDPDELRAYQECGERLAAQERKLAETLGRKRLEWYTDLRAEREDYLARALFRRGLALGLYLSALALR